MTCVEMALWAKFAELNPGSFVLEKKKYQPVSVILSQLPGNLRLGWRITGRPNFNGSFRSLTAWAIDEKLIPDDGSLDATVRLRNSFAHPFETNYVWSPPMTVQVFEGLIETVNHLWPLDMPPDDDKLVLKLR
ncbi:MAG TPA: hypothetical protein VN519_00145 [Bryobacteraceae bacterium]|nr:hypothetical protein [Bryobacteraceae bacterium]